MQESFENIVGRVRTKASRFARSIVEDSDEAQDIVQDVFEKLWLRRSELENISNIDAYIMSSVRNLSLDRKRNRQNREGKHQLLRNEIPLTTTIDIDHLDTASIVQRAMTALPERQREVVHLRDIEGYQIEEISSVIGADPPTTRVLLSRGRLKLRELLTQIRN